MSEKVTYLAGPMRGYPKFNFPAFFDAEEALQRLKWTVANPARLDMEAHPEISDPEKLPVNAMWEYVERDVLALTNLARISGPDCKVAVHFLEGWHKSKGARAEHAIAEWLGLERIYL